MLFGRFGLPAGEPIPLRIAQIGFWLVVPPLVARGWRRLAHRFPAARRMAIATERCWARGVIRALRMELECCGLEHIDPEASYIVAPLHEGLADIPALLQLPLPLRFVVRDELFGWPLLGPYLRDTGQVLVSPETGVASYRGLLRRARELTAAGDSLVIFPQGTILGIESRFRPGAFAVARALNLPILPIALTGSHRVWEHPYSPRLRFGQRVSLRVLPPIPADRLRMDGVEAVLTETQAILRDMALDGSMAAPRRFVPADDGYWDGYAYEIDPAFTELAEEIRLHRARIDPVTNQSAADPASS